ncbi:MAG: hypothetical protein U5R30_00385 [Deltaproteobacteria bacterium]|nr:hypothetical protein [Deltaproteobacteria bacterium]
MAATELCSWRQRLLEGSLHSASDNAFALGGIAGHAGLFGSAGAVHTVLADQWETLLITDKRGRGGQLIAILFCGAVKKAERPSPGFDEPRRPDRAAAGTLLPPPSVISALPEHRSGWIWSKRSV